MKIVLVGGFWHESDTFNPIAADPERFDWAEGDAIFSWIATEGAESELHGAIMSVSDPDIQVVPLIAVSAPVSGPVPEAVFETFLTRLVARLESLATDAVAGVYFGLHGSTTVVGRTDAQAEIVATLRKYVGTFIPLVVSVDLHASPSIELQRQVDSIIGYHTAPHRDVVETGGRAMNVLLTLIREPIAARLVSIRIPLLLPGEFGQTDREPMQSIMDRLQTLAKDPRVLDASLLQGYPWSDNPNAMVSLVATLSADAEVDNALEVWIRLGAEVFQQRSQFYQALPVLTVAEALALAASPQPQCCYLCDSGDNPTAGAVEDRADLLAAALAAQVSRLCFAPIVAPETVAQVHGRIGEVVPVDLGSQLLSGGTRVSGEALILDFFESDPLGGDVAILEMAGNRIIATSRRVAMHSPAWLESLGLDPRDKNWVFVLKSGYLFPDYQDMLAAISGAESHLVATSGASSLNLSTFTYARVPRPMYPLDQSQADSAMTITVTGGSAVICQSIQPLTVSIGRADPS